MLLGPVEDKNVAGKLIEDIADWFDLCRYYHILVESPNAKACAYKEMGKCPAPCDGSISMPQYRRMIEWSSRAIVDPNELIREQTASHAGGREGAALRIGGEDQVVHRFAQHARQGRAATLSVGCATSISSRCNMARAPRDGKAKAFLITPGVIEEIAGVPVEPSRPSDLMRLALERAAERMTDSVDAIGAERIGVVTHHLFSPKATQGVFLPLETLDEKSIVKAYRDLQKQKSQVEVEEEGVMKELQAM